MEFGFEPVCDQAPAGSSYLRPGSQLVLAKFHYTILVADRSEAGRRPVADLLACASSLLVASELDDTPNSSS